MRRAAQPVAEEAPAPERSSAGGGDLLALLSARPRLPRRTTIAGLEARVRIAVDAAEVPTVSARTECDAACGLGFAVARDRLAQLELLRRTAVGRLAELAGPDAVEQDEVQRRLGIARVARRICAKLPRGERDVLDAYAAGVNAFASDHAGGELAAAGITSVEPWTAEDSVAVSQLLIQMVTTDGRTRRMIDGIRRALPPEVADFLLAEDDLYATAIDGTPGDRRLPEVPVAAIRALVERATIVKEPEELFDLGPSLAASNAWAIAGTRTADGHALLANDLHTRLGVPPLWHRARVEVDGTVADGITLPGTPIVAVGSNGRLAWGTTAFPADALDLVELRLRPDDEGGGYWNGSEWKPLDVRVETIRVRGSAATELEVRETEWGPVLKTEVGGENVALHWTILHDDGVDFRLKDLASAASVDEGVEICREAGGPPLSVLLADSDGRIAWTLSGRLPKRASGAAAGLVRPELGDASWSSYLEPEEHPAVVDPPSGILVTCNNLAPEQAGLGVNGFSARRAARVVERLDGERSEEAQFRLQHDLDASFYDFYRELALELPVAEEALNVLRAWDGRATPDSEALPILVRFRERLLHALFAPLLAPCAALDEGFTYVWRGHEAALRALLLAEDPPLPAGHESRGDLLAAAFEQAVAELEETARAAGRERAVWADLSFQPPRHPLGVLHPAAGAVLDPPPLPIPGCAESVCTAGPGVGASLRFVVSPGHEERGIVSLAGGQGSNAAVGSYRADYLDWLEGRGRPLGAAEAVETGVLEPAGEGAREIATDKEGLMADIFKTITEGDLAQVRKAVESEPKLADERNEDGISTVLWALYAGKKDVAAYLRDSLGRELDPWEAAALGELEPVKKLVAEKPGEIDKMSTDGFTPLLLASFFGRKEVAQFLLDAGADPTISSGNGLHVAPIHAATAEDSDDIVDLLLQRKVPLNVTTGEGFTALHNAVQNGNLPVIRKLLELGADPAQPMYEGKTALDFAHEFEHPEAAKLIEAALASR
jgi:penicillin amidase